MKEFEKRCNDRPFASHAIGQKFKSSRRHQYFQLTYGHSNVPVSEFYLDHNKDIFVGCKKDGRFPA